MKNTQDQQKLTQCPQGSMLWLVVPPVAGQVEVLGAQYIPFHFQHRLALQGDCGKPRDDWISYVRNV